MVSARVLQKGVSPVVIIVTGMAGFILFTWQMSKLSLDSNGSAITTSLIWRGVGLALVTVPLTTLAVSSLDPKDIPQGAALNNMMRQLGGSFGIAIVNTFLTYRNAAHRNVLISHITTDNPFAVARLNGYTQYFLGKGYSSYSARHMAIGTLEKVVTQQSNVMSFSDAFLLLTVIFVAALPILFYAGKIKSKVSKVSISDH
jgi:DHA2 family multidrug resistance protein